MTSDGAQKRLEAGCPAWGPGSGYVHISEAEFATLIADRDAMTAAAYGLAAQLDEAERVVKAARAFYEAWLGRAGKEDEWGDDPLLSLAHAFHVAVDALDGTAERGGHRHELP